MTATQIELTYTPAQTVMFHSIPDGVKYQIVTKGRRFGATRGAAHAFIEWALEGQKLLWGDTINSNIDRYVERYFIPALRGTGIDYSWKKQGKQLNVENGYIDFRSADRPENWEGFGYDKIFLNEAGIILKNRNLYTTTVMPMMLDNPNSLLIAAGVPKGKIDRDKKEHLFYSLYKSAKDQRPKYNLLEFSSYDNPLLTPEEIQELGEEMRRMSPQMVDQEIYGKFVDGVNTTLWGPEVIHQTYQVPDLMRIAIGVDPSGSIEGDEVGIVAGGMCQKGNIYVLSDLSGHYSPLQWAKIISNEYKRLKANYVVVERNFGGDMVKANILNVDKFIQVKEVVASRSKQVRAEPVVSLYEQGKVFHSQGLHKLENEMLTWTPGIGKSPNRIDGLVWMITSLMGKSFKDISNLTGYFH